MQMGRQLWGFATMLHVLLVVSTKYVESSSGSLRNLNASADIFQDVERTLSPITRQEIQQTEIEKATKYWTDNFRQLTERMVTDLKDKIILDQRRNYVQSSSCSNSTIAIDFLLEKIRKEINKIKWEISPPASRNRTQYQMIPPPSNTLSKFHKINSRLDSLDVELSTEMLDNCTSPLFMKLGGMKSKLQALMKSERVRMINNIVTESVPEIISGRFDKAKDLLETNVEPNGISIFDLAIHEIVNKTLSHSFPNNFQNLLTFLSSFDQDKFKNSMKFFIKKMSSSGLNGTDQFLRLAYESKKAFGYELEKEFPENFQQLIWGRTQCISNRMTNQYLVSRHTAENGGTAFPVYTTKPSPNDRVENRQGISQFCLWEFLPRVVNNFLYFTIRKNINQDWAWHLNVGSLQPVQVIRETDTQNAIWKITPQDKGQSFSVASLHQSVPSNTRNGNNYLCSTTDNYNHRDVFISSLSNYCKWFIGNLFEEAERQN